MTSYYGTFPVPHVVIHLHPVEGDEIEGGRTFGTNDGGRISVEVGRATTAAHFQRDWLMTHEMVHLSFPSVADEHHWIEEGSRLMSSRLRARRSAIFAPNKCGMTSRATCRKGSPKRAIVAWISLRRGGRTYWGGALFCLLADVEIRQRTGNRKGLKDALRSILEAGGNISEDWDFERVIRTGDRATVRAGIAGALRKNARGS